MASNDEKLEMNPDKNVDIKKALMNDKIKAVIFEKASYTPFIGDGYGDAEEKILFIGDCKLPLDKRFLEETEVFPKVNYCTQIISYCNRDTTKRKIRDEIKNEMNLDDKKERPTFAYPQKIHTYLKGSSLKKISYCNFVYDRFDRIKNGTIKRNEIPCGNDFNKYFKALVTIVEKLNPQKIVFVDTSTEFEINERKQTCDFDYKTFNEWIETKGIKKDVFSCTNNITNEIFEISSDSIRDEDDLKICIDNIGDIGKKGSILGDLYDICERHFDDNKQFNKLLTEKFISYDAFFDSSHLEKLLNHPLHLDPFDSLFSNGMTLNHEDAYLLFVCLKKCVKMRNTLNRLECEIGEKNAYQTLQERINEKKAMCIELMLDMIHPEHLYIAHTLIPSFFKYIDQKKDLEDEMFKGEQNVSTDEFNDFLEEKYKSKKLEKAYGIGKTLKSIYWRFYNDKDKRGYAKMMKESIFINKENREIWQLWNRKKLKDSGFKMWELRFSSALEEPKSK